MSLWSPEQRRWLAALGFTPLRARDAAAAAAASRRLGELGLPTRLRSRLEHWSGAAWLDWPAPAGGPDEAGFKRALWRRIRNGRRGA